MPRSRYLFPLLLALPLLAYIAYPVADMLAESVTLRVLPWRAKALGWDANAQPAAAPLRAALSEPTARAAIWGTLKISLLTVLAGCAWGTALALLWWRREFPGRRFFALAGYAPILMPPLVGTLAFFRLIGDGGLLWRVLPSSADGGPWLSGFGQVLLMHTYAFGLYTYAYVAAALENANFSREEAARSLGAGSVRTFFAAVWPLIRAPLLASALLTLMAAAASFSAPYVLDNASRYLTVEIVRETGDTGMQRALTAVLAALSLAVLPAFLFVAGRGGGVDAAYGVKGSARRTLAAASPAGAAVRFGLSVLAAVLLLAPPGLVVASAISPAIAGSDQSGFLKIFSTLNADDLASLWRSAGYGAAAAAIDVALAVGIALVLRRAAFFAALPVELSVMLALALPGSAVAIALLAAFNGPSPLTLGVPLGQTAAILIMAYAIRNLPLAVRPARAALDSLGTDTERAAAGLGARGGAILWRITLPLILPSLIAAFLICFIGGAGEFVASLLLYTAQTQPVSKRIDELYRLDPAPAYALSLCLMLLSFAAVAGAGWIQRRFAR